MYTQQSQMSSRQLALARYKTARWDLLIVIVLTVLNIAGLLGGSLKMMLFSATLPYFAVWVGKSAAMPGYLEISLVFAGILLMLYLVCWIFSKKHYGWLIAGLVLFSLDAVVTVLVYRTDLASGIFDFVIHAAVIYYLAVGIKAGRLLKTMPADVLDAEGSLVVEELPGIYTPPIRRADMEVECRVFVEVDAPCGHICYRSVGNVHELIIHDYVYAEQTMETLADHEMSAVYRGQQVVAGYRSMDCSSYICLNGQLLAKEETV